MTEALSEISESSDRLEHALAALLRQELNAPIVAMTGFLDIMIQDARRFHLDEAISDLDRMRTASVDLATLVSHFIDTPDVIPDEQQAVEAYRRRLRHDLRTPLNTIKGYGEMLLKDMQDRGHKQLLNDLKKVQVASDELRVQIDAIVDRAGQSSMEPRPTQTKPIGLIGDLLNRTAPIDLERERVRRGQSSRIPHCR